MSDSTRSCVGCGRTDVVWRNKKQRYCSKPCYFAAKSESGTAELTCEHCGVKFRRILSQIVHRSRPRIFCSIACRSAAFQGEASPTWKGGTLDHYRGPNWHKIRETMRPRTEGPCGKCGALPKKRRHAVHHIVPYAIYGNDRHEAANSPANLCVLCQSCHREVEWAIQYPLFDLLVAENFAKHGYRKRAKPQGPRKLSASARKALQDSKSKYYRFLRPDGRVVEVFNLAAFCQEQGISENGLRRMATGRRKQWRGWRLAS